MAPIHVQSEGQLLGKLHLTIDHSSVLSSTRPLSSEIHCLADVLSLWRLGGGWLFGNEERGLKSLCSFVQV